MLSANEDQDLRARLIRAVEVLNREEDSGGPLRPQLETYLGDEVDDNILLFIQETTVAVRRHTMKKLAGQLPAQERGGVADVVLMCAGMAIGKRLGIEDGERMPRL